jgi:hypothetical protein
MNDTCNHCSATPTDWQNQNKFYFDEIERNFYSMNFYYAARHNERLIDQWRASGQITKITAETLYTRNRMYERKFRQIRTDNNGLKNKKR